MNWITLAWPSWVRVGHNRRNSGWNWISLTNWAESGLVSPIGINIELLYAKRYTMLIIRLQYKVSSSFLIEKYWVFSKTNFPLLGIAKGCGVSIIHEIIKEICFISSYEFCCLNDILCHPNNRTYFLLNIMQVHSSEMFSLPSQILGFSYISIRIWTFIR